MRDSKDYEYSVLIDLFDSYSRNKNKIADSDPLYYELTDEFGVSMYKYPIWFMPICNQFNNNSIEYYYPIPTPFWGAIIIEVPDHEKNEFVSGPVTINGNLYYVFFISDINRNNLNNEDFYIMLQRLMGNIYEFIKYDTRFSYTMNSPIRIRTINEKYLTIFPMYCIFKLCKDIGSNMSFEDIWGNAIEIYLTYYETDQLTDSNGFEDCLTIVRKFYDLLDKMASIDMHLTRREIQNIIIKDDIFKTVKD